MTTYPGKKKRRFPAAFDPLAEQRRSEIALDSVPGCVDRFRTVEGIFAGDALAPAFRAMGVQSDKKDAALGGATEAGFEEMHQRHANFTESDRFNLHSCPLCGLLTNETRRHGEARTGGLGNALIRVIFCWMQRNRSLPRI